MSDERRQASGGGDMTCPRITVVICTYNREESLCLTLTSLVNAQRVGLCASVIVVDNNSTDGTRAAAESFQGQLEIQYFLERRQGKAYCLNTALTHGRFGDLVAFLDDDMTVEPNWLQGVVDIASRHPDCDIFTGTSYVIWPSGDIPGWARSGRVHGYGFSVMDCGAKDAAVHPDRLPSGNHYWIRARVLTGGIRFDEPLLDEFATGFVSDPDFLLQLFALGCKGVSGADACVGHRIQPRLLDVSVMRTRAKVVGKTVPYGRSVYPGLFSRARLLQRSLPFYWLVHVGRLLVAIGRYQAARFGRNRDHAFCGKMLALVQVYNNLESVLHPFRIRAVLRTNQRKLEKLASVGSIPIRS
jgi:glycosyltransferase involved in cell wall biosynthesis